MTIDSTLVEAAKREGTFLNWSTSAQVEQRTQSGKAFETARDFYASLRERSEAPGIDEADLYVTGNGGKK